MLDLAVEKQHLAQADSDIAEGEQRIAGQATLIDRMRRAGRADVTEAEALLDRLRDTMQTWRDHRAGIMRTIASIERGEFGPPSRSNPSH